MIIKWIAKLITNCKCECLNLHLGPFWKLQVRGNQFDCPPIWTKAALTYKQQKCACQLFLSKYFFSESDFSMITQYLFNLISKMFCNSSPKMNMPNCRNHFLLLFVWKLRDKLNEQKQIQKVIWTIAFRGCKNFDNSFYIKNLLA